MKNSLSVLKGLTDRGVELIVVRRTFAALFYVVALSVGLAIPSVAKTEKKDPCEDPVSAKSATPKPTQRQRLLTFLKAHPDRVLAPIEMYKGELGAQVQDSRPRKFVSDWARNQIRGIIAGLSDEDLWRIQKYPGIGYQWRSKKPAESGSAQESVQNLKAEGVASDSLPSESEILKLLTAPSEIAIVNFLMERPNIVFEPDDINEGVYERSPKVFRAGFWKAAHIRQAVLRLEQISQGRIRWIPQRGAVWLTADRGLQQIKPHFAYNKFTGEVVYRGQSLTLSKGDMAVLEYLIQGRGRVMRTTHAYALGVGEIDNWLGAVSRGEDIFVRIIKIFRQVNPQFTGLFRYYREAPDFIQYKWDWDKT